MSKSMPNPKVDFYFKKAKRWQEELMQLRTIALSTGLTEELKWGCPCYTWPTKSSGRALEKSNIVLIHDFKDYCALLFIKGSLLKDPKGILIQQTKNVQAGRQLRFTNLKEITKLKSTILSYIKEAIENEKAGLKVPLKKVSEFKMPEEFQRALDTNSRLETAFYELTPGRQRGYILYFSTAKQAKTREARIEKYKEQILKGKGIDD